MGELRESDFSNARVRVRAVRHAQHTLPFELILDRRIDVVCRDPLDVDLVLSRVAELGEEDPVWQIPTRRAGRIV